MSAPYATDYTPEQLERTRQTLLQVLVALGDFHVVVVLVGGLVPSLLIDQAEAAALRRGPHRLHRCRPRHPTRRRR